MTQDDSDRAGTLCSESLSKGTAFFLPLKHFLLILIQTL